MSGSKGTNTTTTNTQAPPWLSSAYMGLVGQAQNVAQTPYQAYGGELVAGVNPQESAGIGAVNQYANWAQPYLASAANYATNAAAPITQGQIQSYENPEAAAVSQATLANFNTLNQEQNQSVVGNAISAGAWGGDRASVAQSELAAQQAQAEAPTLANINLQSYNTGLSTALTEQQQQAQAAYSLGNIGTAAQQAGLTGAGAMIQGGQLQQGTQQQLDTAQMQQYLASRAYPYQQLSWLGGLETGVGGVAGGTSDTTGPAPNPFNTIAGLGATALGAYLGAARGGRIPGIHVPHHHFDAGGATPYSGGYDFIPAPQQNSGRGLLNPSMMLMYGNHGGQQGQGTTPSNSFNNLGGGLGKYFANRNNGISTDGAGSGFPQEGSSDALSLGSIVPMTDSGFGTGVATGGAVTPDAAGQGFADGGDPSFDARWLSDAGIGAPAAAPNMTVSDVLASSGAGGSRSSQVDNPDSAYNRTGLAAVPFVPRPVPRPNVGYTGTDMPGVVDASDITLNGGRGGLGLGTPYNATNPALEADAGRYPNVPRGAGIGATSAGPSGGIGNASSYAPTPAGAYVPPARSSDDRTWQQKLSLPLMQAGFAMMASRSPFLGEAIGQGGLSGIGAYVAQEHEQRAVQEKEQDIGLRAKQLSDMAEQHAATLKQLTSNQQQQRELEQERLSQSSMIPHTVGTDTFGKPIQGVLDPKTKTYVDPLTRQPIDMEKVTSGREAGMQATAHGIANYALPPISPMRQTTPEGMMLNRAVMAENPDYKATYFNEANKARSAFGTGKQGDVTRSFSTAISHLNVLSDATDALNNGDVRKINQLKQYFQTELGLSTAPTSFDAIKPIVAAEITKAIVGGQMTQGDREEIQAGLKKDLATMNIKDVIEKYKDLMGGQLVSLERQYRTSTHGAKDFEEKLSPEATTMLHKARTVESSAPAPLPPKEQLKPGQNYPGYGVWSGTGFRQQAAAP